METRSSKKRKMALLAVGNKKNSTLQVANNQSQFEPLTMTDRFLEDSQALFSYFPEEIWLLITDKITDSNTLTNLTMASSVFRNLLLPRRVQFLFPQIWKVLGVKFEEIEGELYSYDPEEIYCGRDVYRYPFGKTPWYSSVLTLRLICKSWCRGIDKFYENLPDKLLYIMKVDSGDYREKRMGEWTRIEALSIIRAQVFMNHFDSTHFDRGNQRCPIICREIRIYHGTRNNQMISLLSKYGQHFLFCEVDLKDVNSTMGRCYSELREILKLLPNLKKLKITYTDMSYTYTEECPDIPFKPMPRLHKLEFLSLQNFPGRFLRALILANNHISMLEIQRNRDMVGHDIYTIPLPNLKQLSIKYLSLLEFERLNGLQVNWSLEKIYLDLSTCSHLSWSEIFSLLENKWATTLTSLAINLPPRNTNAIDDSSSLRINLPKVQRLKLKCREYFSLDFILPMKNVEFLDVVINRPHHNKLVKKQLLSIQKSQIIQFCGNFDRFENSNIWKLFPRLKRFQFGDDNNINGTCLTSYTREACDWEEKTSSTDHLGLITNSVRFVPDYMFSD